MIVGHLGCSIINSYDDPIIIFYRQLLLLSSRHSYALATKVGLTWQVWIKRIDEQKSAI